MDYTVKQMAALAHVTVKTLHHYHRLGLLVPGKISDAGYRLYGQKELERLQQILFFRELDFSLSDIATALAQNTERVEVLTKQRHLLTLRLHRLERLIQTLDETINHETDGVMMNQEAMFKGFNEAEWKEALAEQSNYLKDKYGYDLLESNPIQADQLNEAAQEVIHFQTALAQALRDSWSPEDARVQGLLADHVAFLNGHGHSFDAKSLLAQARFMIKDDFHRKMMGSTQIGLAYYYLAVVEAFADQESEA